MIHDFGEKNEEGVKRQKDFNNFVKIFKMTDGRDGDFIHTKNKKN